jgi:hypothetical protein
MRLTQRRVPCQATGTCRRVLFLGVIWSLLLFAGCGASAAVGAAVPTPSGTEASHRLSSLTCTAVRAAEATPIASPATVPTGAHLSYERLALGPLPLQLVYHLGATLRFTWCALADPSQVSSRPVPETLTAGFIGPFATRAAAKADQLPPSPSSGPPHNFPPPGPVVASTVPIRTTTWNGTDESAPLTLPATLASGYYLFFAQDDISVQACAAVTTGACTGNGGGSGIVQITAA